MNANYSHIPKQLKGNDMVQHNNTPILKYLRIKEVTNLCGLPKSSFYEKIKQGLMPPPISLGERAVAWVDFEIDAVNRALLAGASKEDIKALVLNLVEQRIQRFEDNLKKMTRT